MRRGSSTRAQTLAAPAPARTRGARGAHGARGASAPPEFRRIATATIARVAGTRERADASRTGSPAINTTIAGRCVAIEARRRALGCSQQTLAVALGVSRATVARLLRGQISTTSPLHVHAALAGLQRVEVALRLIERGAAATATDDTRSTAYPAAGAQHNRARKDMPSRPVPARGSRAGATEASYRAAKFPVPTGGLFRILIAEDDAATVELYRMVLAEERQLRYAIDIARTARQCLEYLLAAPRTQPYDVLLMDLGLADLRGGLAAESLLTRLAHLAEQLPRRILVVSGISPYRLQLKREQLAAIGAEFLAKPFDVGDLLDIVRSLCLPGYPPPPTRAQPAEHP